MYRILFISALLFFTAPCFATATALNPDDSLYSTRINSQIKQKQIIQTMNKEQLTALIDSLFQLPKTPADLLIEIKTAIAKLTPTNTFPSSEYYQCWEINKLFPEKDMLKMKGDTSVTIILNKKGHDDYFHPFNGNVTSDFGWRDSAQNNGIDIQLNRGDKVAAAFDGMVRYAQNANGYGNVVVIRHYNGLETVYGHLSKIKVKPGQVVLAGQIIGLGGNTGASTAPHLHFEVRFKDVPLNPKYLISFSEQKLLCNQLVIKQTKWGIAAYPKGEKTYTIEKGDTLFEIAKHFATSYKSLKEINGFNGWVKLKPGQIINVAQ